MRQRYWRMVLLLSVLLGAMTLGGCGVKGPLYFPEEEPGAQPKEVAPEDEVPPEDELPY